LMIQPCLSTFVSDTEAEGRIHHDKFHKGPT
jgi:hypothetical protein